MIRLEILDEPAGKGRPRFDSRNGRAYTPAATKNAEAMVRAAWDAAGRPTLPADTPLNARIICYLKRPAYHFKRDGTLSAAGQRSLVPTKKPDVDNAAKLVLDALERYAYPSDAAIVVLTVGKTWTASTPRTVVEIEVLDKAPAS